jgi:hypothetical protein
MNLPYPASAYPRWSAEEDKLVGVLPDEEVARLTARALASVQMRRFRLGRPNPAPKIALPREWKTSEIKLLGQMSDGEVAKRTGHPAGSVWYKRTGLGIRVYDPKRSLTRGARRA